MYLYKGTGWGGYRNRDKVYIPIYTRLDDDDDNDDDDATDYITLYICTCKQNVRKQKQFGRYTGTLGATT